MFFVFSILTKREISILLNIARLITIILFLTLVFFSSLVNASPLSEEVSQIDYGEQPSEVQKKVRDHFELTLKDPASADYKFGDLYKGWCKGPFYSKQKIAWSGWALNVMVNAKNSYGGYTGYEAYTVTFRGDSISAHVSGADFGVYSQICQKTY